MLYEAHKTALAEHRIETEHRMNFKDSQIWTRATGCMGRVVKEAIAIRLHSSNFNTDTGFPLSCLWYPATGIIKQGDQQK
jgi:hypothetical protein